MKILITGAGGWLGSELTEKLLEEGNYVKAITLSTSNRLSCLEEKYHSHLEIVIGDICDKDFLRKSIIGIDFVYHLAAKVHCLPKNVEEENEFFKINAYASEQLFKLCLEENIKRVIFYSSVSVYGELEVVITNKTPKNPVTPYAKSKLMAEEIGLKLFNENGLPIIIIEPVTVYGGKDIGNFEKLKSLINKGITIRFGDGLNKKTVIYYKDLIDMTIKIAQDSNAIGQVIICGTEIISLNNIIKILRNNVSKKMINFNLGEKTTRFTLKMLSKLNLVISKKISRQIKVLNTNNEYDLKQCKKYLKTFTRFEEYYN